MNSKLIKKYTFRKPDVGTNFLNTVDNYPNYKELQLVFPSGWLVIGQPRSGKTTFGYNLIKTCGAHSIIHVIAEDLEKDNTYRKLAEINCSHLKRNLEENYCICRQILTN